MSSMCLLIQIYMKMIIQRKLPGMVASIDVLAGKRTVLDYFWQPMAKVKERAFTD